MTITLTEKELRKVIAKFLLEAVLTDEIDSLYIKG